MAHLRAQIRTAATAAITSAVGVSATVNESRARPYTIADLPVVNVYASSDRAVASPSAMQSSKRTQARTIDLRAQIIATTETGADAIAEKVEQGIFTDHTFGGLAVDCVISGTTIEFSADGEAVVFVCEVTAAITYRALEGSPATPA